MAPTSHQHTLNAFLQLGKFLPEVASNYPNTVSGDGFADELLRLVEESRSHNGWHTPDQVLYAIKSWGDALTQENFDNWLSRYDLPTESPKTIAVVMAGNIPLVGFHDFMCVLLAGHNIVAKLSSNDALLLPLLSRYLISVHPELRSRIRFTTDKLGEFDAVIATGSNNTARYFEYYFRNKPSIIRKNRHSAAILTGRESQQELTALGEDIFRYFGLGCRNVSKLFVPKGYNFDNFFNAMYAYRDIVDYEKYANNYDYNKAVFLMSRFDLLDNGFMMIKEDASYASPIATVFYEYYEDDTQMAKRLIADASQLQCIVSQEWPDSFRFGQAQKPALWDYADGVDTLEFLTGL